MHDFKRELILEEAGRLFVRDGYESMKIADLAKNVEVAVGTIYTLFGSKENLYTNYIMSQIDHYGEVMRQELAPLHDPKEKVKKLVAIKYEAMTKNRNAMRQSILNDPTFFMNNTDEDHPLMELFAYIATEVMAPLSKQLGSKKNPMELAFLLDGLSIGYIKYAMLSGEDLLLRVNETTENFLKLIHEEEQ